MIKMYSQIWNNMGMSESTLFSMRSMYSDEAIIPVSEEGNSCYSVKDAWTEESNANFFRCFPNCSALTAAL